MLTPPTPATLEDFDYDAQPATDRALITQLATCRYLDSATNILLIRPPGTGKTHLAIGLTRKTADAGYPTYLHLRRRPHRPLPPRRHPRPLVHHHALVHRPTLLVIDELSYLPPPAKATSALFQAITQRHTKTTLILTTNRGAGSRGKIPGDTTTAMLDRLLHRSVVLNPHSDSYRPRDHHARTNTLQRTTTRNTHRPLP